MSDKVVSLANGVERTSSQTDGGVYRVINQNGYRYEGKDPDNYVTFNNEVSGWRIIGAFRGYDIGIGNNDYYIKLIRDSSIGNYTWDSDNQSNNWVGSSLNTYLNGTYYNGLYSQDRSKILKATYYLGTADPANMIANDYYSNERNGNTAWGAGSDSENSDFLGIMYPSDYGYAMYAGSSNTTCVNTTTSLSSYDSCTSFNWLYINEYQWTIMPMASSGSAYAFYIDSSGIIPASLTGNNRVFIGSFAVRPVLYLSADITIAGGNGSKSSPYTLK